MRRFLVTLVVFSVLAGGCGGRHTFFVRSLKARRNDDDHVTAIAGIECGSDPCPVHHCVTFIWAQGLGLTRYDDPDGGSVLVWDQQTVCQDRSVAGASLAEIDATSAVAIPKPGPGCDLGVPTCPTIRVLALGPDGKPLGDTVNAFDAVLSAEGTMLSP